MLISLNWLKEFVDIDRSAEDIADLLTMGGTEVEGLTYVGTGLDGILVAQVREVMPHPNSSKLRLARIDTGSREITVVCGAPNLRAGQKVPYVGAGVTLPSGILITEATIQGISSPGMLCSEKELAISDDGSGIMELDANLKIGSKLAEALPYLEDVILEVSVTPNRGDCLSVLGVAREIAALTGKPWKVPQFELHESSQKTASKIEIEIKDPDLCHRYVAGMIEGVKIGPSPLGIRLRLTRSGVRPISNVVDATNLVLLECGQPLHAFDYSLLRGAKIVVSRCRPGDKFKTLDGVERALPENSLMICDGERSVALAGIMGGLNSEINNETRDVLIESACFERFGIRRTAKTLGMSTEASYRFERGIDPEGTLWACRRVAYLIAQSAGGTALRDVVDVYPNRIVREKVSVRPEKVNRVLGIGLTTPIMVGYLKRLGITVEEQTDKLIAEPPSWRWDLEREIDFTEEVARVHGFQNIPITLPYYESTPDRTRSKHTLLRRVNNAMNAAGFNEIVTMSFVSAKAGMEFQDPNSEALSLLNPLTEEHAVMRRSLLPGLLSVMQHNLNFRYDALKLYEMGKTFTVAPDSELPREDTRLAGLAVGPRYPLAWNLPYQDKVDFYDMKGALENVADSLGVNNLHFVTSSKPFLHPGKSADLLLNGELIGFLGELSPEKSREYDLTEEIYVFELLLEPLLAGMLKEIVFQPIPRYPYIERDLSIIIEEKVSSDAIKQLISRLGHDIICSVILFDLYRGESIPGGHKSMAFRLRYQSDDRTLTDEEVQGIHSEVLEALSREFGASIRS